MNMNQLAKMAESLREQPKKNPEGLKQIDMDAVWKETAEDYRNGNDYRPRYKVRDGKIVLRMYAVLAKPKPASNVVQLLPKETKPHAAGNICPHCEGKGIYKWHIGNRQERCFRCHGKGSLNGRDMHYYQLRTQGDRGPICHVVSA